MSNVCSYMEWLPSHLLFYSPIINCCNLVISIQFETFVFLFIFRFYHLIVIISLTAIGSLRNLETLNLMSNEIEEIPNEISGCIRLKTLQLDCNRLSCINQKIMQLQHLQDLSVSRNRLGYIPFGMFCSFNLLFIDCFVMHHLN